MADLLYLTGLRLGTLWLEVQDFLHPVLPENMMASFHSLLKTETQEETSQLSKTDIGVGGAAQNLVKNFIGLGQPAPLRAWKITGISD
jgi:hypothetical protein